MPQTWYMLSLMLVLSVPALGQRSAVLRVPQSYKSIQSAINAAHVGDTVLIDHGRYYENIRISKNIVLASRFILDGDTSHISETVIDGRKYTDWKRASAISIEGRTDTNTVVTGLTIRGGAGTHIFDEEFKEWWLGGGGIHIGSYGARIACNVIAENVVRSDSLPTFGGGIAIFPPLALRDREYTIVEHNTLRHNRVQGAKPEAGGIGFYASGRIVGNTIQLNKVVPTSGYAVGGGIYVWSYYFDSVSISMNRILENSAQRGAGVGIAGRQGNMFALDALIVNNLVAANSAEERGGGFLITYNVDAYLINNTIVRNNAGRYGSGLDIPESPAYLLNNIVYGNTPLPQIFSTSMVQAYHNLIEDGLFGDHNIQGNPLFLDEDMTSVDVQSPLLGGGKEYQYFHGRRINAPQVDIDGKTRHSTFHEPPHIGACEYNHSSGRMWDEDHATKLWVSISADLGELAPDSLFSVERRATKVKFFLNDTLLLEDGALADGIHLPSHDAVLLVEMTYDRGRNDPAIWTSYMLEGRDHHDSYATARGFEVFSGLLPGTYTLKLRTEHSKFIHLGWAVDRVRVHVPPPWWETWWFRGAIILASLGLFLFIYNREVSRLRREKRTQQAFSKLQIESQDAERKRLAAELHDGLGQSILLANNELVQYLQQPNGSREGVRQASILLQESIHSVREMASNLHPHQIERLGFGAAVQSMTDTVSHATRLAIKCRCNNIDGILSKETEVQLYRIIQEALSNVVHHASAREASVEIGKGATTVEIVIRDDGKGFDPENVSNDAQVRSLDRNIRGFGLSGMTERARIIGAELKVESSPGNGTTVSIFLPLRQRSEWNNQRKS